MDISRRTNARKVIQPIDVIQRSLQLHIQSTTIRKYKIRIFQIKLILKCSLAYGKQYFNKFVSEKILGLKSEKEEGGK